MATTRRGAKDDAPIGSTLLVIHNFAARSGDELALSKGDRIELIERDDDFGDGWFLGKHLGNGRTGLFPEVYTTPAPKPTLPNAIQQRGASDSIPRSSPANDASSAALTAQYRHASATAASPRPVSATAAQLPTTSSVPQPTVRTSLPAATATATSRNDTMSTTSPVMNETLSVIDEHMNDMSSPAGQKRRSVGPGYSYIAGQETDEEESQMHTEAEVMAWSPDQVAEYLEDHGVEKTHCEAFKEQEITGEVLLAMEQSSLFLKEFSLGSVGRRLKTWHKIRALQDEVRQVKSPEQAQSTIADDGEDPAVGDAARSRASTVGSALPRALDTSRQSTGGPVRNNTLQPTSQEPSSTAAAGASSIQATAAPKAGPETTWSPSAQTIREMQYQRRQERRQSSLDREAAAAVVEPGNRESHRKQPSLDQSWKPGQPQTNGKVIAHAQSPSAGAVYPSISNRDSSIPSTPSNAEQDKDDFSSTEVDSRSRTSTAAATSKTSADIGSSQVSTRTGSPGNRRSTYSGSYASPEVIRDSMSPTISQGILGALNSVGSTFGSMRSATSPTSSRRKPEGPSPVVTKLDYSASSDNLAGTRNISGTDESGSRSATSPKVPFLSSYKPKLTGIRTISDAITRNERQTASPVKDREESSPALPGSTTPSTETQSLEAEKAEAQARSSAGDASLLPGPASRRIRVKPKKATSAYTRGLERKSPTEQMIGSDYSGWMKKKSGSLMTTWKTRLFILRGRRLSYYYSDADTEEKGLIDISFHRVLPAHNETLTGLHAAMTGAASNPTSPKESLTQTAAQKDLEKSPPTNETDEGMFIFKLVPPKSGLPKGVNFTKPTVHYFAVNSRQEGRLWMAALMKATIDRDEDGVVTTTYNQKTISLAKARARRERPPALMETDDEKEQRAADDGRGLGIGGLLGDAIGGAEKGGGAEDASSLAPSTVMTGIDSVGEKGGEGVATN